MFAYRWAGVEIKLPSCSFFFATRFYPAVAENLISNAFLPRAIDNKISVAWVDSGVVVEWKMRNLKFLR